jgi:hypothetical protein
MRKLVIKPIGNLFGICDTISGSTVDDDGEFSSLNPMLFDSPAIAWGYVMRKKLTYKTEIINLGDKAVNTHDKIYPLFLAMKNGSAIKSVTYKIKDREFVLRDFFVIYYLVAVPCNSGSEEFDLVSAYAGAQCEKYHQFYMNWVTEFELY